MIFNINSQMEILITSFIVKLSILTGLSSNNADSFIRMHVMICDFEYVPSF